MTLHISVKDALFNASSNHKGVVLSSLSSDMLKMRSINLTIPKIKRIHLVVGAESPNSPDAELMPKFLVLLLSSLSQEPEVRARSSTKIFGISSASGEFGNSAPTPVKIILILGIMRFIDLIVNVSEEELDRSTPLWLDEALKSASFTKFCKVTYFNSSYNYEGLSLSRSSFDIFTIRSINLTIPKIKRILLVKGAESPNSTDAKLMPKILVLFLAADLRILPIAQEHQNPSKWSKWSKYCQSLRNCYSSLIF